MGSKSSKFSCATCRRKKTRYDLKKIKRRLSSTRRRGRRSQFDNGDVIGNSTVIMQRIESRSRRLGSTRTNRQASINLANFATAHSSQLQNIYKYPEENFSSCDQSNGESSNFKRQPHAAAVFLDNQIKRVGSIPEVNHCPDISTISPKSGCNQSFAVVDRSGHDHACTPSHGVRIDDVIFEAQCLSDLTDTTTLAVPPNSLNSQFISGITPLDSAKENEEAFDSDSDSVFDAEPNMRVLKRYDFGYTTPINPRILLNNNTISISPRAHEENCFGQLNASSCNVDESGGPGFDSDFGASAGVEMKIVSSDNTYTDSTPVIKVKTSALKRWMPNRGSYVIKKPPRREKLNGKESEREKTNSSVSRLYTYYKPLPDQHRLVQSVPRSRPATVPESSSLHVSMEWDPYDPTYETCHWMEYIIPGVTYPPPPLLNDQQYWL